MSTDNLQARAVWETVCAEQGWNDQSKVAILLGFITETGQLQKLAEYAEQAAGDENNITGDKDFFADETEEE